MTRHRWLGALAALLGAALAAQAGVWLLWPRSGVVTPVEVSAVTYFSGAQLVRAQQFRGPQLPIYLAQTLLALALLTFLALRPPRWLARLAGGARRPLVRVAATAAALSLLLALAALPLAAVGRQRAIDVGLVTRSWLGWAQDVAAGSAIQAALMALTAVALIALMRRLPRWWWVPASAVVVAGAAVLLYVTPVVVDPLFNRFTPVRGEVRAEVLELAERAGVDVGEVFSVDASRRTTGANAYVAGFGPTKRVVLYDNLLANFPRDELRFVVAHELAHQHYDDVPRGLLYVLLIGPAALAAVALMVRRLAPGEPGARADARAVPALALALALVVPIVTSVSNQLSRRVEARADTFALELTDAPDALVGFRVRSVVRNVSDPDPPPLGEWLLGTHPTALERIGAAEAWRRGARP